jgi:rhamnose transport system permease protein
MILGLVIAIGIRAPVFVTPESLLNIITDTSFLLPIVLTILLSTFCGLVLGVVDGAVIAVLGIPPVVVTLGTLAVYRGLIFFVAGGKWLTSDDLTPQFLTFPKVTLFGISSLAWIAAVVIAGFWFFLSQTRTGRALYAVGGNPVAACCCGIDLAPQQLLVYSIARAVSTLCGYLWVSRYGIAYVDIAQGYELTIIPAA